MDDRTVHTIADPGSAWSTLDGALPLTAAEVIQVELPFLTPVDTALGTHRRRPLVLVRLTGRRPDGGTVVGWGECAALADSSYDAEDAERAYATLAQELVPRVLAMACEEGTLPSVGRLGCIAEDGRWPLAFAALEMAVGDAHLRSRGRSFASLLGVGQDPMVTGAVLGVPRSPDQLTADLVRLRTAGYARVKVKIAPGVEEIVGRAVRAVHGDGLPVQVDANGSYGVNAADRLRVLDDLGLLCVEQPLPRYDLAGHRRLATRIATPICLDESLDSPARVVEAVEAGACAVVCVKPARLGGIGAALRVIAWCTVRDVPWWIGGMFESGFARGVNRVLASLPGPSFPGDLAPPSTYLGADLVESVPGLVDPVSGRLTVPLPAGPGLGPAPDPGIVGSRTVRRTTWPATSE